MFGVDKVASKCSFQLGKTFGAFYALTWWIIWRCREMLDVRKVSVNYENMEFNRTNFVDVVVSGIDQLESFNSRVCTNCYVGELLKEGSKRT